MEKIKVQVNIDAKPGDKVWVSNYRKKRLCWELAVVLDVDVSILKSLIYDVTYRVMLDRRSTDKWGNEKHLFLTVGHEEIELIQEKV